MENKEEFYEFVAIPCLLLSAMAAASGFSNVNMELFLYLNSLGRSVPDTFWASLTVLGDGWVAIVLGGILLIYQPRLMFQFVLAVVAAAVMTHLLKYVFAMPRPAAVLDADSIYIIGQKLSAPNSFPSGHTITAFTLGGFIAFNFRIPWLLALLFMASLLIGLSRVFVGAHWPTDIMFGGAVGWFIAWLSHSIRISSFVKIRQQQPYLISRSMLLLVSIAMLWHETGYEAADWLVYAIAGCASIMFGSVITVTLGRRLKQHSISD